MSQTSLDTILDGQIVIEQPTEGYRVAVDPVFLAASIPANSDETVLDIGTGVGAALLCLARRVPSVRLTGLEVQPELVRLAQKNVKANGVQDRCEIMVGSLLRMPPRLAAGSFHHVMANPPYYDQERASLSPVPSKRLANAEADAKLKDWVNFAHLMVRPKGTATFIYVAERMDELLGLMSAKFGEIVVYPLWPGIGKDAKRVLVRGRKNVQTPARLSQGLVLHEANGKVTSDADEILRNGLGLEF